MGKTGSARWGVKKHKPTGEGLPMSSEGKGRGGNKLQEGEERVFYRYAFKEKTIWKETPGGGFRGCELDKCFFNLSFYSFAVSTYYFSTLDNSLFI